MGDGDGVAVDEGGPLVPIDERVEVRAKIIEGSHRNRRSGLVRGQRGIPDEKPGGAFRIPALHAVSPRAEGSGIVFGLLLVPVLLSQPIESVGGPRPREPLGAAEGYLIRIVRRARIRGAARRLFRKGGISDKICY